ATGAPPKAESDAPPPRAPEKTAEPGKVVGQKPPAGKVAAPAAGQAGSAVTRLWHKIHRP
ncbi:MAG: hypothetical protein WB974_11475, partial [Acidobacteriaceae bacterium]